MTVREHAILVPTRLGPVGAIVAEPAGPERAVLLLLPGIGPEGRSGVNGVWARAARAAAADGALVMRADLPGERESDLVRVEDHRAGVAALGEALDWLCARARPVPLLLAGSCYGAAIAIHLAARRTDVAGLGLIVPHLGRLETAAERAARLPTGATRRAGAPDLDPLAVHRLAATARRLPVWVLAGKADEPGPHAIAAALARTGAAAAMEVTPVPTLHGFGSPALQDLVVEALVRWVGRATTASSPESLVVPADVGIAT